MKKAIWFSLIIVIVVGSSVAVLSYTTITHHSSQLPKTFDSITSAKQSMKITSSAFTDHHSIPQQYTCDGKGINPPLEFQNVPNEAKGLVLIMDDPDIPKNINPTGMYAHWVVYNMDPRVRSIPENSVPLGMQGLNSAEQQNYTPPCPPDRQHRYFFKLYAVDTRLHFVDPAEVTKQMVIDEMKGHIIAEAELVGVYNRPQNK